MLNTIKKVLHGLIHFHPTKGFQASKSASDQVLPEEDYTHLEREQNWLLEFKTNILHKWFSAFLNSRINNFIKQQKSTLKLWETHTDIHTHTNFKTDSNIASLPNHKDNK